MPFPPWINTLGLRGWHLVNGRAGPTWRLLWPHVQPCFLCGWRPAHSQYARLRSGPCSPVRRRFSH